jgi:hypothetical protein
VRHVIFCSALIAAGNAFSQDDPRLYKPATAQSTVHTLAAVADTPSTPPAPGTIAIHESTRIDDLMKDYGSRKHDLKGFRVQIFLGDRAKAEETRRAFLMRHPEIPAYLSYLAPNFRVRVGDLRTKLPAEKLRSDLKDEYPGLYVVPDLIELPRAGTEKP